MPKLRTCKFWYIVTQALEVVTSRVGATSSRRPKYLYFLSHNAQNIYSQSMIYNLSYYKTLMQENLQASPDSDEHTTLNRLDEQRIAAEHRQPSTWKGKS